MRLPRMSEARGLLRRLLESGRMGDLGEEERVLLQELSEHPDRHREKEARPLWWWIRDGFHRAPEPLRQALLHSPDDELDDFLDSCGARRLTATLPGRLLAPVTRLALKNAIERLLQEDNLFLKQRLPALVAGLAGLREAAPALAALVSSGRMAMPLVGDEFLGALLLLESEDIPRLLSPTDPEWIRLGALEGRAARLSLSELLDGLGEDGWTAERASTYPGLVEAFTGLGGKVTDLVKGISASPHFESNPPNGVAVARALLEAEDPLAMAAALEDLRDRKPFLGQLYVEVAAAGYHEALPALEREWDNFLQTEEDDCPPSGSIPWTWDQVLLPWAMGVLRDDGPGWIQDRSSSLPELGALQVAQAFLAITRDDAAHLLHPLLAAETETVRTWAGTAWEAAQGRPVAALVRSLESPMDPSWTAYLLQRISRIRGVEDAGVEDAFEILCRPCGLPRPVEPSRVQMDRLIPWCRIPAERARGLRDALLERVRYLPADHAALLLEALVLQNLDDPGPFLLELGCVDAAEERVGALASTVLGLFTTPPTKASPLPDPHRSLAVAFLADGRASEELRLCALQALEGDPSLDALVSALVFRGDHESEPRARSARRSPDLLSTAFSVMGTRDRLSHILAHGEEMEGEDRLTAARLLLVSSSPEARAAAVPLLFSHKPPMEEARPLRWCLLQDGEVRLAVLDRVGVAPFEREELDAVLRLPTPSEDEEVNRAVAAAIARLGQPDYCGVLYGLLHHPREGVVVEARRALRKLLAGGTDAGIVFLSVTQADEISEHYDPNAAMDVEDVVAYLQDERREAMRRLLVALEELCDSALAMKSLGRRLIVAPVKDWPPPSAPGTLLSQEEFEKIALHLHVLFVDAATGSIVAEVGEEPSGEILNAIFETGDTAVLQVVWG